MYIAAVGMLAAFLFLVFRETTGLSAFCRSAPGPFFVWARLLGSSCSSQAFILLRSELFSFAVRAFCVGAVRLLPSSFICFVFWMFSVRP